MLFLGDPQTVFTGVKGVESRRKRFVSRNLSLDDIKHVKNLLNCVSDCYQLLIKFDVKPILIRSFWNNFLDSWMP